MLTEGITLGFQKIQSNQRQNKGKVKTHSAQTSNFIRPSAKALPTLPESKLYHATSV